MRTASSIVLHSQLTLSARSGHAQEPSSVPDAYVSPNPHIPEALVLLVLTCGVPCVLVYRDLAPTATEGYKVGQAKTLDELQRVSEA